jgi:hypothetical protein
MRQTLKLNRLGAFTLGVLFSASSIGAVTFVNAASDSTIRACANKKTGAMRFIAKGSCAKNETLLSWNKTGPSGMQGPIGSPGPPGNSGQVHAIDANGKDLGIVLDADSTWVTVLYQDGLWTWRRTEYYGADFISNFRDSSCSIPLFVDEPDMGLTSPNQRQWPSTTRFLVSKSQDQSPTAAYRPKNESTRLNAIQPTYMWDSRNQRCNVLVWEGAIPNNVLVYELELVELPRYTAPIYLSVR